MRRGLVASAVVALVGCKGGGGDQRPAYSDLPDTFYTRAIHQPPAEWSLPGAAPLSIRVRGPVRLIVVPEDRPDVRLEAKGVQVPADHDGDGRMLIGTDGKSDCPMTAAPADSLTLRMPRDIVLHVEGPAWGEVGAARNLVLDAKGCGRWAVEPAAGTLWLAQDGKGSIAAKSAGAVRVALNGGEIRLDRIDRELDALLHGGALTVGALIGNLQAEVWGDGRLDVGSGFVARATLFNKGSGHIFLRGDAGAVDAEAYGSSKIRVAQIRGNGSGTGDVEMGRKDAPLSGF